MQHLVVTIVGLQTRHGKHEGDMTQVGTCNKLLTSTVLRWGCSFAATFKMSVGFQGSCRGRPRRQCLFGADSL